MEKMTEKISSNLQKPCLLKDEEFRKFLSEKFYQLIYTKRGKLLLAAAAMGAFAVGAMAFGVMAIGKLAVGDAHFDNMSIKNLKINHLKVKYLEVDEQI
jgi:hypothetical protein